MKKRILSILLCCVMLLCLMPTAAFAASTPSGTPLTQELIEKKKGYTKDEGISLSAGDYYLTDNVYLVGDAAGAWSLLLTGGDFTLDLNGHVLDLRGANICAFGGLTLKDSSTGGKSHKFRVGESGLWVWDETNGTKTVDGGVITGGVGVTMDGESFGGGVYVYSNLTMEGGSIVGCTAGIGGGVYMMGGSGTFTMEGGRIVGCTAGKRGGGVCVGDAQFTMEGGSIQNCTAINTGGGVYASDQFTVKGGSIRNCAAADGGGLYVGNDGSTMTGGSIIVDCTAAKGGGVCVGDAQFTMEGGSIQNCTAAQAGGGVFVRKENSSHFTIENGSIENCKAGGVPNAVHADGKFDNNTGIEKSLLSGINGGQTGAVGDPILIGSADGLNDFRDRVNGIGKYSSAEPNLCAKLLCDIVLNDGTFDEDGKYKNEKGNYANANTWTPIGTSAAPYTGTFDGDGHTIKGLYVKNQQYAGLFGYVKTDSYGSLTFAVKNLTVTGYIGVSSSSAGNVYAGGIIGCAKISPYGDGAESGAISGCVNRVIINASSTGEGFSDVHAGGIVGGVKMSNYSGGTATMEIINCANHAAITAYSENGSAYAGGIAGQINGSNSTQEINSCFNAGEIRASYGKWSACAGGIIGDAFNGMSAESSIIANCLNVGKVTGVKGSTNAGGIAGKDYTVPISNCCNAGKVDGTSNGGIAGNVSGGATVSNCYYLEGTAANGAYNFSHGEYSKTKAEFANELLALLQKGDQNSPWTKTGYLAAAKMTLPLLKWQEADAHTHNYNVSNSDNTYHWTECACGLIEAGSKAQHSAVIGICTDGIKCACGYEMYAPTSGHNWGDWVHNTTSHSRGCKNPGCGLTQSGNCSGGTATCKERATCEVCHEKYGNKDPNNHTDITEWVQTETKHTQKYKCCGAVTVAEEDHEWENGVCTECHYACAHSGGTATCTDKAVCEICGEKYGAVDPDNHTDTTEWIQTETKHTQKYKCCGSVTVAEEDHEWEKGVCSECGYGCRHDYEWQSENGQYWQKCKFCNHETAKKDIPTINISGADKVCRTQDYKFSFTLPEGATDAAYGYEFIGLGDGPLTPTVENNLYSGIIKASVYPAEENSFKLIVSAKTADGFDFSAEKTVTIQNEHTGGEATCREKAKCEICGESYGELKANNHADMKHIEAKAATKTAEGNIEHWYCADCDKYFADKDGAKEITKADTVTAKLPEEKPTSPKTGDTSNLALWIALLFVSGGVITGVTVAGKKKKQQG